MRDLFQIWMFLILLCAVAPAVQGCSVPVFRYALEAWFPAPYEMIIFYRGKMKESNVVLLEALRKSADDEKTPANITLGLVDVSEKMDKSIQKIWTEQKDPMLPRAVLIYRRQSTCASV